MLTVTVCGVLYHHWTSPPPLPKPFVPVNENVSVHVQHSVGKAGLQDDCSVKGRMVAGWGGEIKKWAWVTNLQGDIFLLKGWSWESCVLTLSL